MSLQTVLKRSTSSHTRLTATAPPRQHSGQPPCEHEVSVQRTSQNANKGKGKEVEVPRSDEEIDELIDNDDAPAGETPRVTKLQNSSQRGEYVRFTRKVHYSLQMFGQNVYYLLQKSSVENMLDNHQEWLHATGSLQNVKSYHRHHSSRITQTNYCTPVTSRAQHHQDRHPYMGSPAISYQFTVGEASWLGLIWVH